MASWVTPCQEVRALIMPCTQLAGCWELCQARERHTDPKTTSSLFQFPLTSLQSTVWGVGGIYQGLSHR